MKKIFVFAIVIVIAAIGYQQFNPPESRESTQLDSQGTKTQAKKLQIETRPLWESSGPWRTAKSTTEAQQLYTHQEPYWDSGADPQTSAAEGGRGFTGEGWTTKADYNYLGDPRAIRGGTLRQGWGEFPNTFRNFGKESNLVSIRMMTALMYDSLLSEDPLTLEPIPSLATHWKVEDDGKTFWFRLNPSARWSDGQPVTSLDVKTTIRLYQDPGHESPFYPQYYQGITVEPVSKYLVKITAPDGNWRSFKKVYGFVVYPHHVLKNLTGAQYLKKFQWEFLPGTGPYVLKDFSRQGNFVALKRLKNWWGTNQRSNIGAYNFAEMKFKVYHDFHTELSALKKGEIDLMGIGIAQAWAEQLNDEGFATGALQKRRIFNLAPSGTNYWALNMRRWPFNEKKVRQAMCYLVDFESMNERFFYDQYERIRSYFPNSVYEAPENKPYTFDVNRALELLREAGYTQRNSEGVLVREGQALELELLMDASAGFASERIYENFVQSCRKAGIKINLVKKAGAEMWKLENERKFDIIMSGRSQLMDPWAVQSWGSQQADLPNSNNVMGVKNERVDDLLQRFEEEPDLKKRIPILQKVDRILWKEIVPAAPNWMGPFLRVAYQGRLTAPDHYIGPFSPRDTRSLAPLWWVDPRKIGADSLPIPEVDVKPWTHLSLD